MIRRMSDTAVSEASPHMTAVPASTQSGLEISVQRVWRELAARLYCLQSWLRRGGLTPRLGEFEARIVQVLGSPSWLPRHVLPCTRDEGEHISPKIAGSAPSKSDSRDGVCPGAVVDSSSPRLRALAGMDRFKVGGLLGGLFRPSQAAATSSAQVRNSAAAVFELKASAALTFAGLQLPYEYQQRNSPTASGAGYLSTWCESPAGGQAVRQCRVYN